VLKIKRYFFVISHAHWDREWYQTFQAYRKRLVFMIDELINHMEKNEDYKYFHMDGQTIVLEDYLRIRPENEKRLKDLIQQGRIIIGPWYVMPDEFLVSGESLVRNLQKGFEISKSFGVEPMKNGYVVDIFGHNSQFPQILRGFGIDSAILFRGIGDYPKDAFTWEAADGSSVFCIKLDPDRCYSNFYFAIRSPFDGREYEKNELVSRMKGLIEYNNSRAVTNNMIMMDGVDHIEIEPKLTEILAILNENMEEIEIKHSTLEEFVNAQKNSGADLEVISGELYNIGKMGVNNAVLKNVLSSMVHLKQANNECETLLTRWAEPFDAAANFIKPQDNEGFFKEAWEQLLQNHPHDSICGCSITPVHKDNEYRFNQARYIAEEIIKIGFEGIVSAINTKKTGKDKNIILFNASQQDFNGIVEVEIELPEDSQNNFKIFDSNGQEIHYQLLGLRKSALKLITSFRRLPSFLSTNYYKVAFPAFIPAVGYNTYGYEEYRNSALDIINYTYTQFHAPTRYVGSMQAGHSTWENEYLKFAILDNGTLEIINKETGRKYKALLLFEDCADVGEGWNYKKPIMDSKYLSLNEKVEFSVEYDGPLKIRLKLIHNMKLPIGMHYNGLERSKTTEEFRIITFIEMRRDSSVLEFNTLIDNNIGEHRLRVLFPTYLDTEKYYTSTPFFMQERNICKPDTSDYMEVETNVCPNQGIIVIKDEKDSLGLYNKGLYEVEVTEDSSHTIALTLFRSFKNEVGRNIGEMSFMKREMSFEYALEFKSGKTSISHLVQSGDMWRTGVKTICTDSHEGHMNTDQSFLKVNVPGVMLSAFKTGKDGMKIIRLYNYTSEIAIGNVELYKKPEKVFILDLNDEVLEETEFEENIVKVSLKPAKILTIGLFI
jgi:mannosylglycerate hydrolase